MASISTLLEHSAELSIELKGESERGVGVLITPPLVGGGGGSYIFARWVRSGRGFLLRNGAWQKRVAFN